MPSVLIKMAHDFRPRAEVRWELSDPHFRRQVPIIVAGQMDCDLEGAEPKRVLVDPVEVEVAYWQLTEKDNATHLLSVVIAGIDYPLRMVNMRHRLEVIQKQIADAAGIPVSTVTVRFVPTPANCWV